MPTNHVDQCQISTFLVGAGVAADSTTAAMVRDELGSWRRL
jgi:hypothetical protein